MSLPSGSPSLDRTPSAHSRFTTAAVWCFERPFEGQDIRPPVRVVIFDCDETLTLSTFLPHDDDLRSKLDWESQWADYIAAMNFESPFVVSSRRARLAEMLRELVKGNRRVPGRTLAVLTRNNSGAIACLNLLRAAKLDSFFSAVWGMSPSIGVPLGVYRSASGWKIFEPPFHSIPDHKAHVLHSIAENPGSWFPQLSEDVGLLPGTLRPEEILLVDDVRTNFQCGGSTPKKVFRCCKVARYDAPSFRDMGFVRDMGGIGAHNEEDYKTLTDFANRPWAFKVDDRVHCWQSNLEPAESTLPVKLVIFDLDGALTLYTFMPEDSACSTDLFFSADDILHHRFVEYNFETPYLEGNRVAKLKQLFDCLCDDPETGERRVLAILTVNEAGAVAVLNLLRMAGLADRFSAIWTLSARSGLPGGVYKEVNEWKTFSLPQQEAEGHLKHHVLESVLKDPAAWFPQMSGDAPENRLLAGLSLPHIVLVDDERENLNPSQEEFQVGRHCRVASYDDEYRDQGLLWRMGGLGARDTEDYQALQSFVRQPWHFNEAPARLTSSFNFGELSGHDSHDTHPIPLQRSKTEEDLAQRFPAARKRRAETCGLESDLRRPSTAV
ncbi:unnamed protein product [Effrenium voratum]|uniref:Uncharacterized protein n=1 Tax=Effrenium voratum TaxID=2562239 RepID=A0AA36HPM3_9DINO|nr:unnamed protein product [Effrenium voratum]